MIEGQPSVPPVRVAVLGVGSLGRHHARLYAELAAAGEVQFAGVFDTNRAAAEQIARDYHTQAFASVEEAADDADALIRQLTEMVGATANHGVSPVLVCSAALRPALSRLVRATVSGMAVVSYAEIGDHLQVDVIANVDISMSRTTPEEHFDAYAAT